MCKYYSLVTQETIRFELGYTQRAAVYKYSYKKPLGSPEIFIRGRAVFLVSDGESRRKQNFERGTYSFGRGKSKVV